MTLAAAARAALAADAVPEWIAPLQTAPIDRRTSEPALATLPPLTEAEWRATRGKIEAEWREYLGAMPKPEGPPAMRVIEETELEDGLRRQYIEVEVEPGIWTTGYLHLPPGEGPFPAVVSLHPTAVDPLAVDAGLNPLKLTRGFGVALARRGFVTISLRNYLWTADESPFSRDAAAAFLARKPGVRGMMKMIYDGSRAVDLLETMPQVDPKRIGAIGHSLGGKEALYLPAFDPRIACAVASEGGLELEYSNYQDPWYLDAPVAEPGFALKGRDLLLLIAPRPFLLIGGDAGDDDKNSVDGLQSWPGIARVIPLYRELGAPEAIGLFVHGKGHDVPLESHGLALRWMEHFLK